MDGAFLQPERESAAAERPSSDVPVIHVGHLPITDHLAIGVLRHLITEGELQPRHFRLETRSMANWAEIGAGLRDGSLQSSGILAPLAMHLVGEGLPIRLVLLAHRGGSIFVRSRVGDFTSPYSSFFRGRSLLIPHEHSVHHILAHMFFDAMGLRASSRDPEADVKLEVVPPPMMIGRLKDDPSVCGFLVAEPLGTKAIAAGVAEPMYLSSELWKNHPCCAVVAAKSLMEQNPQAVAELTEMLIRSGNLIQQRPDIASTVAVDFLDPTGKMGLKVPLLRNVLTESDGIKTHDLLPERDDLVTMQRYLSEQLGVSKTIDFDEFVDDRFARAFVEEKGRELGLERHPSVLRDVKSFAPEINARSEKGHESHKSNLDLEGRYLSFIVRESEFAVDIMRVQKIIGYQVAKTVPNMPSCALGVINLRDMIIPVYDLGHCLELGGVVPTEQTCIIIVERRLMGKTVIAGFAVDEVLEVRSIDATQIRDTPYLGEAQDTSYISAMATLEKSVLLILNLDCMI